MQLGDIIFKCRKRKKMTQEELGDKLGVSRQTVSKWESGKVIPDLDKITLLSKIFDISLDEMIKDESLFLEKKLKDENTKKMKKDKNENESEVDKKTKNKNELKWIISLIIFFILVIIMYLKSMFFGMITFDLNLLVATSIFSSYNLTIQKDISVNNIHTSQLKKIYKYAFKEKMDDSMTGTFTGNSYLKIVEYDDNSIEKIKKETYIDMSKRSDNVEDTYNGVIEINKEDNTYKIIDNYEYKEEDIESIISKFKANFSKFSAATLDNMYKIRDDNNDEVLYLSNSKINNLFMKNSAEIGINKDDCTVYLDTIEYNNNKENFTKVTYNLNGIGEKTENEYSLPNLTDMTKIEN